VFAFTTTKISSIAVVAMHIDVSLVLNLY